MRTAFKAFKEGTTMLTTTKLLPGLALGLLLLLGGCAWKAPETRPPRPPSAEQPPADLCAAVQRKLAGSALDSSLEGEAARQELQRILAALQSDPAVRGCLAARMVDGSDGSGR